MNNTTTAALLAAITLAIPGAAHAWEHTTQAWLPEDFPLIVRVADDGQDGDQAVCNEPTSADERLDACCEETVPGGYCLEAAQRGYAAWHDAQCAEFSAVVLDGIAAVEDRAPNIPPTVNDLNYITFNDPGSETGGGRISETGTLAVTFTVATGLAFILNGQNYTHSFDTDIVFNDNVQFDTHENIVANNCNGGTNFLGVMTHEIGHSLGMGHSCDNPAEGALPCTDPTLRDATMFWSGGPCQSTAPDINSDDIEGITTLYGPFANFTCSHQVSEDQVVGVVPFDLNCVIDSEYLNEVVSTEWNFGDGGISSDRAPTHRYTEAGNYTIQVDVHGERDSCGEDGWDNNFRKIGYVRACDVPISEFEVGHIDGLQYQMINQSDVSVFGCISDIQWDVYQGESATGEPIMDPIKAWEPIIEFPDKGTYTVVMSLGGIAGTGGSGVTFEAVRRPGDGSACNSAGGTGGLAGAFLLGGLLLVSRRRGNTV